MTQKIDLNGLWDLSFVLPGEEDKRVLPAKVPGEAEAELAKHGLLGDLIPPDRIDALWDIASVEWEYSRKFCTPPAEDDQTLYLVFDGVDAASNVYLNEKLVLETDNAMIPHRVDVTDELRRAGEENILRVVIKTDVEAARKYGVPVPGSALGCPQGAFLRKARHVWGWDNAPVLPARGIWRGVHLDITDPIGIEDFYSYTIRVDKEKNFADLGYQCTLRLPEMCKYTDYTLRAEIAYDGKVCASEESVVQTFYAGMERERPVHVENPKLWNPIGYGEPNLYDFTLTLLHKGEPVAQETRKVGLRQIELVRTPVLDENSNGEFVFYCNGEKIYIRGTNWKVLDCLHSKSKEKLYSSLEMAKKCNCNMIRVWGGGVYEDDDFFDWCDANGMLVWQDFMFACESPASNALFEENVYREAVSVICQLRNHASLALWCGDNEADNTFFWGDYVPSGLRPNDNNISRRVLKRAVREFDPWRDYMESSPYIDDSLITKRSDRNMDLYLKRVPELHYYPDGGDFPREFDRCKAHFISETGPFFYNAMSETPEIVARELPRMREHWNDSKWRFTIPHQTTDYLVHWIESVKTHLMFYYNEVPEPSDSGLSRLIDGVNISVAEVFKYAIESFRRRKFYTTGLIWWSLCDMWPMAFNFSVADSNGKVKLPYYWIAASQEPTVIIGEKCGSTIRLWAVNDTLVPFKGKCKVSKTAADGSVTELSEIGFECPPNDKVEIGTVSVAENALLIFDWGRKNHLITGDAPYSLDAWFGWRKTLLEEYALYNPQK